MNTMELETAIIDAVERFENIFDIDRIADIKFNSRLTRALGRTVRKRSTGKFELEFNPKYFELASHNEKLSVIYHELIHTVDGCFNHSNRFKKVGYMIESVTGLTDIASTKTEASQEYKEAVSKFTATCTSCDRIFHRRRSFNGGHDSNGIVNRYRCKCGGNIKVNI